MLYVSPDDSKNMYKMYKVLKDISYDKEIGKVEAGDVVLSYVHHDNSVYFQTGKEQYYFFSLDRCEPDELDKLFEEIEYAYYYDNEEKRVRSIDIEDAHGLSLDDREKCFADEDKAFEILEKEQNKSLPKNIEFKTFISSYIPNLGNNPQYSPEPLEIVFEETRFLLAIDWYRNNIKELEKFLSKEVFNSYVQKIWLNQEDNRIGVTLTSSKYRD